MFALTLFALRQNIRRTRRLHPVGMLGWLNKYKHAVLYFPIRHVINPILTPCFLYSALRYSSGLISFDIGQSRGRA